MASSVFRTYRHVPSASTTHDRSPLERWITARHEAAHAVVARLMHVPHGDLMILNGVRPDGVTGWIYIRPSRAAFASERAGARRLFRKLCVDLAPIVTPGAADDSYEQAGFGQDLASADEYVNAIGYAHPAQCANPFDCAHPARIMATAEDLTRAVVASAEPAIEAVAELAYASRSGRLTAPEIRACVTRALPAGVRPVGARQVDALLDGCWRAGCFDADASVGGGA